MNKAITVPLEVLENPVVPLQTKIVYCVICSELKRDAQKGLIYDDLAVKCGLTRKQLIQSIQELVELQLLADHPLLHDNTLRREIRLGTVTDWSKVTERPVKQKTKDQPKGQGKPKAPDKEEK